MIHLGDITKIDGGEIPVVDVITGGSPCQDLSVAGKRAGLDGERSGLFMEQVRVVKEMRERDRRDGRSDDLVRPRYMVWENVPGAFSSGNPKGEDFRIVLEEIARVEEPDAVIPRPEGGRWSHSGCIMGDRWSLAWRVHDAQFWGVPQRRKRIALVADFGGLSAPEILFERKGLSGDSEPCGEAGQETAGAAGEGVEGASCYGLDHVMLPGGTTYQGRGYYDNVSGCLKTQPHGVCETISFQERVVKPGGGKGILIQEEHGHQPIVWNGKADGASGNGVAFATVGDHENRPTDMTNLVIGTYQTVTGALTPGAHPGSYNRQDAYNDMLVVDDGDMGNGNRTGKCRNHEGGGVRP